MRQGRWVSRVDWARGQAGEEEGEEEGGEKGERGRGRRKADLPMQLAKSSQMG